MSLVDLLWIAGCISFASFAQSLSGFGFSLIAVPLMTLVVSPRDAVVVATVIGALSTTSQAFLDRAHVDAAIAKRLTMASFLGMPLGLTAFVLVSETGLRVVLGIVVLVSAVMLLRGFQLHDEKHRLDWILGIVSGFLSTSTSTNGPPLVFVMQARRINPTVFRATRKVNTNNLSGVLVAIPALFVALKIGYYFRKHITPERFRFLVISLMFLSAGSVIVSAFTN
ncbi:MAG: hypothetical protein RL691_1385 [Actinomycetota bacterium]